MPLKPDASNSDSISMKSSAGITESVGANKLPVSAGNGTDSISMKPAESDTEGV